jgi:hypothetical protein
VVAVAEDAHTTQLQVRVATVAEEVVTVHPTRLETVVPTLVEVAVVVS